MKEEFTPAPWKFNAHDGSITDCTKAENEIATAQLGDWHVLGRGYANAHLIAAAPKMYNEIELDIEWLERLAKKYVIGSYELQGIQSRIENKRKLLAEARGEL